MKYTVAAPLRVSIFALIMLVLLTILPFDEAHADYSVTQMNTKAQVLTDANMDVVEQRTYSFDQPYSALKWRFSSIDQDSKIDISSVRLARMNPEGEVDGDWITLEKVAFISEWRDYLNASDGTARDFAKFGRIGSSANTSVSAKDSVAPLPEGFAYAQDPRQNDMYVFLEGDQDSLVIECDYSIEALARVFDDVGEIYWDYIAQNDSADVSNVSCVIQLPVPDGIACEPGVNVFAWGHGPDGTVDVRIDGTVALAVPFAQQGQYAQVHVLFPENWLANLPRALRMEKSGVRLDDAILEESSWVDSYSAWKANDYTLKSALVAFCILLLIAGALIYAAFGRSIPLKEPEGSVDEERLPLPVQKRLLRWNHESDEDFAACVRDMADREILRIDPAASGSEASQEGQEKQEEILGLSMDAVIRVGSRSKAIKRTRLEDIAMDLLFEKAAGGYLVVSGKELAAFKEKHPQSFAKSVSEFQHALDDDVARYNLFDRKSIVASRALIVLACVSAFIAIICLVASVGWLMVVAYLVCAAILVWIANYTPRMTVSGERACLRIREQEDALA